MPVRMRRPAAPSDCTFYADGPRTALVNRMTFAAFGSRKHYKTLVILAIPHLRRPMCRARDLWIERLSYSNVTVFFMSHVSISLVRSLQVNLSGHISLSLGSASVAGEWRRRSRTEDVAHVNMRRPPRTGDRCPVSTDDSRVRGPGGPRRRASAWWAGAAACTLHRTHFHCILLY